MKGIRWLLTVIHRWPADSPHKGSVIKCFLFLASSWLMWRCCKCSLSPSIWTEPQVHGRYGYVSAQYGRSHRNLYVLCTYPTRISVFGIFVEKSITSSSFHSINAFPQSSLDKPRPQVYFEFLLVLFHCGTSSETNRDNRPNDTINQIYNHTMHQSNAPHCTSPVSHNAPFCYRNVHICAHFFTKRCVVEYLSNALWDLWGGSIVWIILSKPVRVWKRIIRNIVP